MVYRLGYHSFDKTPLSALIYTAATLTIAAASFRWMEEPILKSRIHLEQWLFNAPERKNRNANAT